jgi:hypothetical protein
MASNISVFFSMLSTFAVLQRDLTKNDDIDRAGVLSKWIGYGDGVLSSVTPLSDWHEELCLLFTVLLLHLSMDVQ